VCGWTYPQIDALTLPQLRELFTYWAAHPPLHELAAAYLGLGRRASDKPAELGALLALAPDCVLRRG
jgi:hypothetical protein